MGGEAGFEIDHFRPLNGASARPDLKAAYSNLYWSCRECNSNKGDSWPKQEDIELGLYFFDPCTEAGDHEKHWIFLPNGELVAITPNGEYTEEKLLLWRPFLVTRRLQQFKDIEIAEAIRGLLIQKKNDTEEFSNLQERLSEIENRLQPPVFDRARRNSRPETD